MIDGVRTHISIGGYEIPRSPHVGISMARHRVLSSAFVVIADAAGDAAHLFTKGDRVEISYGYRSQAAALWRGTVKGVSRPEKDQMRVEAVGAELPLVTSTVKENWCGESAAAIAKNLLQRTGLAVGNVAVPGTCVPHFPVASLPVAEAVRQLLHTLERAFGYDMRQTALWLDGQGALQLGSFDEVGPVVIASGETLIRHRPYQTPCGTHFVEAFLLPQLRHCQTFLLRDERLGIEKRWRALEVVHDIRPEKVRTFVHFGEEYARF